MTRFVVCAIVLAVLPMSMLNPATAQPLGEVPEASTICAAIGTTAPARPAAVAPGKARAESDRLVAEAAALIAQPSRQTVAEAIGLLEQATTNDPGNAVAFAR